jgi:hypothetical protein
MTYTPSDAARALSKLGARKGGQARARNLSPAQRSAIARKAGLASGQSRRSASSNSKRASKASETETQQPSQTSQDLASEAPVCPQDEEDAE